MLIFGSIVDFLFLTANQVTIALQMTGHLEAKANPATGQMPDMSYMWVYLIFGSFRALIPLFVVYGSIMMIRGKSYNLAKTAMVFAMMPCISACCFLGIPFACWGFIELDKEDVKDAFR